MVNKDEYISTVSH